MRSTAILLALLIVSPTLFGQSEPPSEFLLVRAFSAGPASVQLGLVHGSGEFDGPVSAEAIAFSSVGRAILDAVN